MEKLYNDKLRQNMRINDSMGPTVTKEEITKNIKRIKINKAAGPEEARGELIKLLNEGNIDIFIYLFNLIYEIRYIPSDCLTSIFVPIPKIKNM